VVDPPHQDSSIFWRALGNDEKPRHDHGGSGKIDDGMYGGCHSKVHSTGPGRGAIHGIGMPIANRRKSA
jgi:hypothetical protein